jgi:hypothetical protein
MRELSKFKNSGFFFVLIFAFVFIGFHLIQAHANGKPTPLSPLELDDQVIVDDVDINKLDIEYCQVVGQRKFLSTKVKVTVDYGQPRADIWESKIKDKDGKTISFRGMMDALNFMYQNGWEYVGMFIITHNDDNVYHFLLRKKKDNKQ